MRGEFIDVGGARLYYYAAGSRGAAAFGGDEVVGLIGDLELHHIAEDVGILSEDVGELSDALLPRSAVDFEFGRSNELRGLGLFAREIGRGIFFLRTDLLLGFDFQVAIEGAGVASVGGVPEGAGDGFGIIRERERHAGEGAVAMIAVGVVLCGAAEADLNIDDAVVGLGGIEDGSVLGGDGVRDAIGDRIAEEVRLGFLLVALAEGRHGTFQLGIQGGNECR